MLLGATLARRGVEIVYGGGRVGLMGIVADAALANGGKVTGVMPQDLFEKEIAHPGLTRLHIVQSLHERKQRMAELAHAFIALPGGAGTLDEIVEQWAWAQLGLHGAPCGFVNVDGYFDGLRSFVERSVRDGFTDPGHAEVLLFEDSIHVLLDRIQSYAPPRARWEAAAAERRIRIAAALLTNPCGQMLVVRKTGTQAFMQPGGKIQDGETDLSALAREIEEELGVVCNSEAAKYLGTFTAPAANEPGWLVKASLFQVAISGEPKVRAEIEEMAWIDAATADALTLAPLTRDHVLPLLAALTDEQRHRLTT